jgi:hypothetical protein
MMLMEKYMVDCYGKKIKVEKDKRKTLLETLRCVALLQYHKFVLIIEMENFSNKRYKKLTTIRNTNKFL